MSGSFLVKPLVLLSCLGLLGLGGGTHSTSGYQAESLNGASYVIYPTPHGHIAVTAFDVVHPFAVEKEIPRGNVF